MDIKNDWWRIKILRWLRRFCEYRLKNNILDWYFATLLYNNIDYQYGVG
jgi:hypothetical protein